jgi:hypothetical protein
MWSSAVAYEVSQTRAGAFSVVEALRLLYFTAVRVPFGVALPSLTAASAARKEADNRW